MPQHSTQYSKNLPSDTILWRTIRGLLNLPTAFLSSAYLFLVTLSSDKCLMRGIMARPYVAIASELPWVDTS